ncbi:MAG: decaprenyl-phosphate phosphoribosyltransferase [Bryobacteraceae bacterium]|nr:decaprenyl-phosphate phosphoribosyltransferase [Bryobacteraceae bacterium]
MFAAFARSVRPEQWVKNLFVLAPLLFGRKLTDPGALVNGLLALLCFCLLAGALYILNDIVDAEADRRHPEKRRRPIASGALPVSLAAAGAAAFALAALLIAWRLGADFAAIALLYALVTVAYSFVLKHLVILDVMAIASGFVIRVMGGALAVDVEPSHWLIICAFVLSLFLGFSKRRQELLRTPETAVVQRRVLREYSIRMVEQINLVLMGTAFVCYMIYTVAPETVERFGTDMLLYGTVFVFYGMLRYLVITQNQQARENPGETLLADKPLLIAVFGWALYNALVIYWPLIAASGNR